MTKRYKIVLFIRFIGYLAFCIGLISFIFLLEPLIEAEAKFRIDRVLGVKRTVPMTTGPVSFDTVDAARDSIIPVSTEYGLVIEKINANAKIIPAVNPANEQEYTKVLSEGVAEALGSTPPGQKGNLYLFSHSTDAPWNIVRYNAIFYLLRELVTGDQIIIFYKNKRYDYVVFDKNIASPEDISFLVNRYDVPILTLQTCDPPGTLLNRLIIRARLVNS